MTAGTVIDLRSSSTFAKGHVPGTLNIPFAMLAAWAGWLIDYDRPTYLICEPSQLEESARILHKIGVEEIVGAFDAAEVRQHGLASETYATGSPEDLLPAIESGQVQLLDVRSDEEWREGHVAQAQHRFLGRLQNHLEEFTPDQPLIVQCQSGARSAIGVSVLQAAGLKNVINLTGGYRAWKTAGLPSVTPQSNTPQTIGT